MEILQAQNTVFEKVVPVHTGQQHAMITAAIKVNIAHGLWLVQCARNLDDIVHITRQRLVWRYQGHDIFHAGAHGIEPQIDFFCTGKTYRTSSPPNFFAILLHQEIVNADTVQAAAGRKFQTVIRLLKDTPMIAGKFYLHPGIMAVAPHRTLEISQS